MKIGKRKEVEDKFLPFTQLGKQIRVITKIEELPLRAKTIRIVPRYPSFNRIIQQLPKTEILYGFDYKTIDFYDINSPIK